VQSRAEMSSSRCWVRRRRCANSVWSSGEGSSSRRNKAQISAVSGVVSAGEAASGSRRRSGMSGGASGSGLGTRRGRADDAIADRSAATLAGKGGWGFERRRGFLCAPQLLSHSVWHVPTRLRPLPTTGDLFLFRVSSSGRFGLCRFLNLRYHFGVWIWVGGTRAGSCWCLVPSIRCTRLAHAFIVSTSVVLRATIFYHVKVQRITSFRKINKSAIQV
jgi:hypothetical protein